jgi:hypothetical protein
MTLKDLFHRFANRFIQWIGRWVGTLFSGAPKGMAHVATDNHGEERVTDAALARALLEPYEWLFDRDRHRGGDYQTPDVGVGDFYHREYRIAFETATAPEAIVRAVTQDLNRFTNPAMAVFQKRRGDADRFEVGDRFEILITGPWNGPVEVVDSRPGRFSFVTLKGHLEAGFITFEAVGLDGGRAEFVIRSWATCSDRLVWFSYAVLGMTKYMQTKMWRFFCLRVAQEFGDDCSGLAIRTYRIPPGAD